MLLTINGAIAKFAKDTKTSGLGFVLNAATKLVDNKLVPTHICYGKKTISQIPGFIYKKAMTNEKRLQTQQHCLDL